MFSFFTAAASCLLLAAVRSFFFVVRVAVVIVVKVGRSCVACLPCAFVAKCSLARHRVCSKRFRVLLQLWCLVNDCSSSCHHRVSHCPFGDCSQSFVLVFDVQWSIFLIICSRIASCEIRGFRRSWLWSRSRRVLTYVSILCWCESDSTVFCKLCWNSKAGMWKFKNVMLLRASSDPVGPATGSWNCTTEKSFD